MADAAIMKQIEQAEQTEQTEHIVRALQAGSKKLHWRSALSRVLRLRRSGGLVNNDILAALQITLHPPSSTSTLSPKMLKRVKSYAASKEKMRWWNKLYPVGEKEEDRGFLIGLQYCERLITQYRNQTKGLMNNGRWVYQPYYLLHSPPIERKRRKAYHTYVETSFVIQYGLTIPYRTCGFAQNHHPGESTLSSTELIALLLLAIECQGITPNQPFYTSRVFAFDAFTVRRLTAKIPSSYVDTLLQSGNKSAPKSLIGEVIIEQTPYFNLSDSAGVEGSLTAIFEDDDKEDPCSEPESGGYIDFSTDSDTGEMQY